MLILLFVQSSVDVLKSPLCGARLCLNFNVAVLYMVQIQISVKKSNIWNRKQAWPMGLMEKPAVSLRDLKRVLKQCFNFVH